MTTDQTERFYKKLLKERGVSHVTEVYRLLYLDAFIVVDENSVYSQ